MPDTGHQPKSTQAYQFFLSSPQAQTHSVTITNVQLTTWGDEKMYIGADDSGKTVLIPVTSVVWIRTK